MTSERNKRLSQCIETAVPGADTAKLLALVYEELRAVAASSMLRERADHTLQPTALVHEAYMRLAVQKDAVWKSREHFMAVASQIIRRVLIDHARRHGAVKRDGGGRRVELNDDRFYLADGIDLLALDEALEKLESLNVQQKQVVELRYFGGLTIDETAEALNIAASTVKVQWATARAWLHRQLEP